MKTLSVCLHAPYAFILTSDDHGRRWTQRGATRLTHARLFVAGNSLYHLGHPGDLQIARSDDRGETWSEPVALPQGQSWHQWCFAGLVTKRDSPKQARHYAAMDIDGDDLVILSRSGDARAKSARRQTHHVYRVKDFRSLVY